MYIIYMYKTYMGEIKLDITGTIFLREKMNIWLDKKICFWILMWKSINVSENEAHLKESIERALKSKPLDGLLVCSYQPRGTASFLPRSGEPTLQPQFSSAWPKAAPAGVFSWVLLECSEQAGPGKETSWWRTPDACNRSLRNTWGGPHLRGLWHHQHPLCMQVGGSRQTAIQPVDVAPGAGAAGDTDLCPASPAPGEQLFSLRNSRSGLFAQLLSARGAGDVLQAVLTPGHQVHQAPRWRQKRVLWEPPWPAVPVSEGFDLDTGQKVTPGTWRGAFFILLAAWEFSYIQAVRKPLTWRAEWKKKKKTIYNLVCGFCRHFTFLI